MGFLGIGGTGYTYKERSKVHPNIAGATYEHVITRSDGKTYTGWGWSAREASEKAHDDGDRDR